MRTGPLPFAAAVVAVALAASASGQTAAETPQGPGAPTGGAHPKTALVLSGGGARGAAHIGVLRVMEELRIVPDLIVGTSIGSIVGGLYATGWTPDQIETLLKSIDWNNEIFSDRVDRDEKTFRRKQDDSILLIQGRVRFRGLKPTLPVGLLGGQRLELFLEGLEAESTGETNFDSFPIPYRAVAMDIGTGEPYVFSSGSLATAMRSSMAIPAMFAPVVVDGHRLVDGGSVANLPARIARSLGAERVIAVDISSDYGTAPASEGNFVSTINNLSSLMIFANRVEDVKRLEPGDVYIRPDLGDLSFLAFDRASEAVAKGEAAARAKLEELRTFAGDEAAWDAFKARHHRRPQSELVVDEVRLANTSPLSDATVRSVLNLPASGPFDQKRITAAVMRLGSMDTFGLIRERFERTDGRGVLTVTTPARPQSRGSVQVGIAFDGDIAGNQETDITFRHQLLGMNRLAGEVQTIVQLGQTLYASMEYYQPLDPDLRWFVAPSVETSRRNRQLWADGEAVSDYRLRHGQATAAIGRVLGTWGEVRLAPYVGDEGGTRTLGVVGPPSYSERRGGVLARFTVDTLDLPVFPRKGAVLQLSYDRSAEWLGSDTKYQRAIAAGAHSFSWGANTLQPGFEIGVNLDSPVSFPNTFSLGGLGRLSGLGPNELFGEDYGLARLVYYRRMAKLDMAALRVRVFVGGDVEAGNVYNKGDAVTVASLRRAGTVFVGADTPVGPLFLGWGLAEGGRNAFYFRLGERF